MALTKIAKSGITADAVDASKIADNAIESAQIKADAVNATKIADDSISEEHLDKTVITGHTALSASADPSDVLLIYDADADALKKITASNVGLQAPTITSVTPTAVAQGDGTGNFTFIINGTNFSTGTTANLITAAGATVQFDTLTRNSVIKLTGVIAKTSINDAGEPYDIKVTTGENLTVTLENQINVDQTPTFITAAGSLGSIADNARTGVSKVVNATDPDSAGNVTFEIQSGSFPAGLTLTNTAAEGGTAIISGNATAVGSDTTSNFVLRAVDAASNTTSRAFAITVNRIFTSQSFTSSGTFAVPSGTTSLTQVLLVAGGGGAGTDHGAGGGAGGLIFQPEYPVTPGGTIAVTVGSGGGGHPSGGRGTSGQDSIFGASPSPGKHPTGDVLTASGGGGGGGGNTNLDGGNGGSGGGGSGHGTNAVSSASSGGQGQQSTASGDSGAYGFGNNGGVGQRTGPGSLFGGGGGGAGAVGSQGCGQSCSAGGIGKSYTIADGTTGVYYAGGGAGQHYNNSNTTRPGGNGGGGNSQSTPGGDGQDGGANKGGGAGAQRGDGGKGIVIVRY